ncbi:MAG: repeat protein [Thermoleophilia bacterium]|nr:repeat protein [Thermoleophilia bacterium]
MAPPRDAFPKFPKWLVIGTLVVFAGGWLVGIAASYYALRHEPKESRLDTKLAGVDQPDAAKQPTTGAIAPSPASTETPCWNTYGRTSGRTSDGGNLDHGVPKMLTWQMRVGLMEFPPSYCDGVLYVNSQGGHTTAIDAARKRVIWRRVTAKTYDSTPAISGARIFVASYQPGDIQALDRRTGRSLWKLRAGGGVESSPVVVDGIVYAASSDRRVYALDEATGRVVWAFRAGAAIKDSPSVVNGLVYFGDYAGEVFALHAKTGKVKWKRSFGGIRGDRIYSSVAVEGGRAYFGTVRGKLYALRAATGSTVWEESIAGYVYATPAVSGGTVVFANYPGSVYGFDSRTGRRLWSRNVGGSISGSPTIIGKLAYVSTLSTKRTFALSLKTGRIGWQTKGGKYVTGIATDRAIYLSLGSVLSRWTTASSEARYGRPGSRNRVGAAAAEKTAFG